VNLDYSPKTGTVDLLDIAVANTTVDMGKWAS
jgi:hypothetical protein